jgi:fructose-1,6-bisphosphatase/inositol monophosphatase family enzyme
MLNTPRCGTPDTRMDRNQAMALRDTAICAARASGHIQKEAFGLEVPVEKNLPHDLKLEVDRLCEKAIMEVIHRSFPTHAILSEETGDYCYGDDHIWIVDPLDGTVNFFHGVPYFCTSVSCYETPLEKAPRSGPSRGLGRLGKPLVGVVYAAATDELFTGIHGWGATRNDRELTVRHVTALNQAVVSLSFGQCEETMLSMGGVLHALLRATRKVRCLGSTALDIAQVAAGRLGALVQRGVRSWDIAAGRIILEEAGGVLNALESGADRWDIIACAPGILEPLRAIVEERWG